MIHGMHILPRSLPVMTRLAQGTPVVTIPEEFLVSTVRNDVIHNSRLRVSARLPALLAQGVRPEERLALPLPPAPVPTATRRPYRLRVQGFVCLAVPRPRRNQSRTARMLAGDFWFRWHKLTPLSSFFFHALSILFTHLVFPPHVSH